MRCGALGLVMCVVGASVSTARAEVPVATPAPVTTPAPVATPAPVDSASDEPRCIPPARRAAAATVAVVPGLVVPGLGHLAGGESSTGKKLLAWGGLSLGVTGLAGAGIYLTGAPRRYIAPMTSVVIVSVGTLLGSSFADLYGVLAPGGFGDPPRGAPSLEVSLGYRYVADPTASYASFLVATAELRRGALGLAPSIWAAVDDDNLRSRLIGTWRILSSERDATHLTLEAGLVFHRFGDSFSTLMGEVSVGGRLDLGRLDARLHGMFSEVGAGYAAGAVRYHDLATDHEDVLLGRFAHGLYLGRGRGGAGELAVEYEHRHDDFAGGLKMPGLGSGPAGHFGVRFLWIRPDGWGVRADVQAGAAWVTGVSIIYRKGGTR